MTATFQLASRSTSGDVRQLLRPVPPALADAVGEPAAKHAQLTERLGKATSVVIATRRRLEDAQRADAQAAERAIASGTAMPKAKATKIADELREHEREVETITELIPTSARAARSCQRGRARSQRVDERCRRRS